MNRYDDDEHRHLDAADWDDIAADPEFVTLRSLRRRFAIPGVAIFAAYYFSLPLLVGFAPGLMKRPVFGHLTLAFVYALSEFAMAWIVLALYLARSRVFDYLEARFVRRIRQRYRT